jgi:hypothetical protein
MPFKLRWKKIDKNFPGFWPYSFKKKDLPQLRGPDNYPLLIPHLDNKTEIARRYRDQVRKHEIEQTENVHLKMHEFRKNLTDNFKIDNQAQPRGALPYWQYATRTRLMRGLPSSFVESVHTVPQSDVDEVSQLLSHCVHDFLSNDSAYRIKHEIEDRSHVSQFLQVLASGLLNSSCSSHLVGNSCVNQDVETCGFWGKDQFPYQLNDKSVAFHVRTECPLNQVLPLDDDLCQKSDDIPNMTSEEGVSFNPELYEIKTWENPRRRKSRVPRKLWTDLPEKPEPDIFPGFKVESSYPFVHTQFMRNDYQAPFWARESPAMTKFFSQEVQDCSALLNLFSTTSSLAWFLGFTPYQDVSSPIVCNSVVSDGSTISFYVYQLNTFALGNLVCDEFNGSEYNDRANILWSTKKIPLFDKQSDSATINPHVCRILAAILAQKTSKREFIVPKSSWDPEIPEDIPLIKQVKEEDPGYLKIKMRKPKNRDMRYYEPLYAGKDKTTDS